MTGSSDQRRGSRRKTSARLATLIGLVLAVAASATVVGAGTVQRQAVRPVDVHGTKAFWTSAAKPVAAPGRTVAVHAARFRSLRLDTAAMSSALALAPRENTLRAETSPLVVSLPRPDGTLQRFTIRGVPDHGGRARGRAPRHQDLRRVGLDDPDATVRADTTPLGFHASVRSPDGAWYVDPYYHLDDSVYVSYFGHDLANAHGGFEEGEIEAGAARGRRRRRRRPGDPAADVPAGAHDRPVVRDLLRRPGNVTPAKVTLMNRVDQIYEDETAIRMS